LIINEPFGNSYAVAEMTLHCLLRGTERVLLTPGPTAYHAPIFRVMDRYCPPQSRRFAAVERSIRNRLEEWIGVGGEIVLISGPATSLMEAAITNLTKQDDRGLVVSHGKFGNRFVQIAKAQKRAVEALVKAEKDWGSGFSPRDIAAYLRADADKTPKLRFSFLCLQQNETSSGVAYRQPDLEKIARAARAYNPDIMIVVDAVSGVFAHELDFKKVGADVVVLGSPKGLGVSSGYSYAALSPRALRFLFDLAGHRGSARSFIGNPAAQEHARIFGERQGVHYLNLLRLLIEGRPRRSDTTSVFHALSTAASLGLLEAEGKKRVIERHTQMAKLARSLTRSLRLPALSDMPSNSVTPVLLPDGTSAKAIREQLDRVWGIFVPGAQTDYWKPRLLRIGHIGYVEPRHIARCMRALRLLLRSERDRREAPALRTEAARAQAGGRLASIR
jgi:serine---pyruvate transaminase